MSIEKNKEIVRQYFKALNTKNWELLEDLIHDDYASDPYLLQVYARDITVAGTNPFIEFFRLLGYDDEITVDIQNRVLGIRDRQSAISYSKWLSHYQSNCQIVDMVAEENRVWAYVTSDFRSYAHYKIDHSSHEQITMKDSKIIMSLGVGRYLGSIMQIGKIIIASDNKEEIDTYLLGLRNLGLIP